MHLRVGDIPAGRQFYERTLGLASTRGDNPQSAFLASGGYHHHIAVNTWNSAGAGRRRAQSTGLDWFSFEVQDGGMIGTQIDRLKAGGAELVPIAGGVETADPWGTRLRLVRA